MMVLKITGGREQAEFQWLQDWSPVNEENLNSARCETGIVLTFRNKKKEYVKDKINKLQAKSKNKNISLV